MIKYLVIGYPIGHSRSPGMQNAAFQACGLGRPYGIREVAPEDLPDFFDFARKELFGVNLTVPHKIQAAELADSLTPRAAQCGSVNTLIISGQKILGDSTDGIGLEQALFHSFNIDIKNKKILFCGAGGAARATSVHLSQCGAAEINFLNRTVAKAEELAKLCTQANQSVSCHCSSLYDEYTAKKLLTDADVLIQATSLGLKTDDPAPFPLEWLEPGMKLKIFDTIYHPTKLQKYAAALGIACADGKEMLIRQGAESFRLWTGKSAPLEAMRLGFAEGVLNK